MEKTAKKPSKIQLENRIKRAVLIVDKTKDTRSMYFADRNITITVTEDWAVVGCGYYNITFARIAPNGFSRQYLYLDRFLALAEQYREEIKFVNDNGEEVHSYGKLMEVVVGKSDAEHNIAWLVDKWIYNFECQLSSLGETVADFVVTYEQFMHNAAVNMALLAEKKEDVTNKQFAKSVIKQLTEFVDDWSTEDVIFPKKTDKELYDEEMASVSEANLDESLKEFFNAKEK